MDDGCKIAKKMFFRRHHQSVLHSLAPREVKNQRVTDTLEIRQKAECNVVALVRSDKPTCWMRVRYETIANEKRK